MIAEKLLSHLDTGSVWSAELIAQTLESPEQAYSQALAVRDLRIQRGERPLGYKIGFTNRKIWDLYQVYAPMWGSIWNTTVTQAVESIATVSLNNTCQPRIEPEIVFGFKNTPKLGASLQDLYDSLDWIAPGFEVVQSHMIDWKFSAAQTVADSGLHARLAIGERVTVAKVSGSAEDLISQLRSASAKLFNAALLVDTGIGSSVLDSPLEALDYFIKQLRACPGATDIQAGDIVTTGTWTDAWPVRAGQTWRVDFSFHNAHLTLNFE